MQSSKKENIDVRKILKRKYEDYLDVSSNVLDGLEINMYSYEDTFT